MYQFFVEEEQVHSDSISITGGDVNHIKNVLRMKNGEKIRVSSKSGQAYFCHISSILDDEVIAAIDSADETGTELDNHIVLYQGLPKGDKMDFIVQKAVELGAAMVVPRKSANCVVKYDAKECAARQEKWQRIADEALKQCGRSRHLVVTPVMELADWLTQQDAAAVFMCYEGEAQRPLRAYLQTAECQRYTALIGPEGGFSPAEAAQAIAAGVQTVSLGPRILRAETAALAALSVLQYEKGDLGN